MDTNVAVLVDAKTEYTKQLIQIIAPHLLSGLLTIYDEAYGVCTSNKEEDLTMLTFQELLGEVPAWNNVMVAEEAERIMEESKCDYLEDILTAVFVCHTKILTTVRVTNKDRKINLKIPSVENFIHQVYIEIAREFWRHPYLLNPTEVTKLEYQHNLQVADEKICTCVESTIRKLLPVKDILKEYLTEDDDEGNDEDENPDELVSGKSKQDNVSKLTSTIEKELKSRIRSEIDSLKKDDSIVVSENHASSKKRQDKETNDKETNDKDTDDKNDSTSNKAAENTDKAASSKSDKVPDSSSLQSGGGTGTSQEAEPKSITSKFNSMLDAIVGKSATSSSDISKASPEVKSISVGQNSADANKPESTSDANTPMSLSSLGGGSTSTTTGSTELSLASLTNSNDAPTTNSIPTSTPTTSGSTTNASSEISLDSLGSIDEVKVDYGRPSYGNLSSNPSVQASVLSEFDKLTSQKQPEAPASTSSNSTQPLASSLW